MTPRILRGKHTCENEDPDEVHRDPERNPRDRSRNPVGGGRPRPITQCPFEANDVGPIVVTASPQSSPGPQTLGKSTATYRLPAISVIVELTDMLAELCPTAKFCPTSSGLAHERRFEHILWGRQANRMRQSPAGDESSGEHSSPIPPSPVRCVCLGRSRPSAWASNDRPPRGVVPSRPSTEDMTAFYPILLGRNPGPREHLRLIVDRRKRPQRCTHGSHPR